MLSHGLRSGCHGDRLFQFALGIQPEFSGNLSRTKQIRNALILPPEMPRPRPRRLQQFTSVPGACEPGSVPAGG